MLELAGRWRSDAAELEGRGPDGAIAKMVYNACATELEETVKRGELLPDGTGEAIEPVVRTFEGGYQISVLGIPGEDGDSVVVEYPDGRMDVDTLNLDQNYINIHGSWLDEGEDLKIYPLGVNLVRVRNDAQNITDFLRRLDDRVFNAGLADPIREFYRTPEGVSC